MSAGSLLSGYDVAICENCGFAYADDIPEQAAFDAHYRDMSKYERQDFGGRESQYDLARFRAIAEIIKGVLPRRDARVLDVGCAIGGLLAALKESGYHNLLGIDPSPACAAAARDIHGIEVVAGTLTDLPAGRSPFDLIVLSNILEHVRDLKPALGNLRDAMVQDGMVFVQVPDVTRFSDREDAPFQEFSTEHINYFSPTSLDNLMHVAGFATRSTQRNAYYQEHGSLGPAVDGVYQRTAGSTATVERDTTTEPCLVEYIRQSQQVDDRIRRMIDEILAEGRPIVVWGVGTHTLRLLSTSRLRQADIVAFVDSNPRYQGRDLGGIPIIAPSALQGMPEPILISSRVFQRNIEEQIRSSLKLDNRLYLLYEV